MYTHRCTKEALAAKKQLPRLEEEAPPPKCSRAAVVQLAMAGWRLFADFKVRALDHDFAVSHLTDLQEEVSRLDFGPDDLGIVGEAHRPPVHRFEEGLGILQVGANEVGAGPVRAPKSR